jgi:DNA-binding HxlR family transcriptional regulator
MTSVEKSSHGSLQHCPITRAVRLVGDRWTLLIVRALMDGSLRFNEIQAMLGNVSSGTLSARLKQLEQVGIVRREAFAEIPPRVEYHLTEKGAALVQVLNAFGDFGARYLCDSTDPCD